HASSSQTMPASASAAPDWEQFSEEIHCPLCDYNLRGLVDPRCPECGFKFEWGEILARDKFTHPFLFEHHAERNVRSMLRTLVATNLPRRFWRTLKPTHDVKR